MLRLWMLDTAMYCHLFFFFFMRWKYVKRAIGDLFQNFNFIAIKLTRRGEIGMLRVHEATKQAGAPLTTKNTH